MVALLAITAIAQAITIEDAWATIKATNEFSPMQVPTEDAKKQGFDRLEIALSETVSTDALARIKNIIDNIPLTEQITSMSEGDNHVWIYGRPLTGDKTLLFMVVVNGKQGVALNGICKKSMIEDQLSNLHLNNIFGD